MSEVNNPNYKVLLPEWSGGEPTFDLTAQQGKTILGGGPPHRVAPMDKSQPVHERASTCESVLMVYPHGISVGGVLGAGAERGDVAFGGWLTLLCSFAFLYVSIYSSAIGPSPSFFVALPSFILFFVAAIYFLKSRYMLPKDGPVVFNPVMREVTFSQIRFHTFWRFWMMPGFSEPITVPWDSVQARSYKFTQYMGSSLRDSYRLELWAPTPDDPKKLLVKESIGYLGWYEDKKLWRLFEHIRRYMEEDGPAIQHGEALRKPRKGRDLAPFPESVLATLGGPALSDAEVQRLAEQAPAQGG